jgi:hypothetical protein
VLAIAVAGLVVRLVIDALTNSNGDLMRMELVAQWMRSDPLDVYVLQIREHGAGVEWPYLPAALPIVYAGLEVANALGLAFETVVRLPVIGANLALIWVVDAALRDAGRGTRDRALAAAVLAFAPLLVLESAWHGQVDLYATLAAALGVLAWERLPAGRRALAAGALIGLAAAVKTPLGVVLIALLPLALQRREIVRLIGAAAAVVLAISAPYLIHDARALVEATLGYHGLPGVAGLNLLVEPGNARVWLIGDPLATSGLSDALDDASGLLTLAGIATAAVVVALRRPPAAAGAAIMLLFVYASGVNLALHYAVWIVPFLLMAGWIRASVVVQVALLVPLTMLYWPSIDGTLATPDTPWSAAWADFVYVPFSIALWAAAVVAAVALARRHFATARP